MAAFAIVVLTALSYAIGWAIGRPLLVPFLNTAASFPFMVLALRRGDLQTAIARMLVWAAALGVSATLLSYAQPWRTDAFFVNGEAYRVEMFGWVMSGVGAESEPREFIPEQLRHAAIFSVLALATGGVLAMPMGAALMNYMGHDVGALAASSARPVATMVLGWHPWAMVRVASFVVLGVVLSAPLLAWTAGARIDKAVAKRAMLWAGAGLVVDIVLKAALAPAWQRLLLKVVGW